MCGMKLIILSQTSTLQLLKFGNITKISSHTLLHVFYLSVVWLKFIHISRKKVPGRRHQPPRYAGKSTSPLSKNVSWMKWIQNATPNREIYDDAITPERFARVTTFCITCLKPAPPPPPPPPKKKKRANNAWLLRFEEYIEQTIDLPAISDINIAQLKSLKSVCKVTAPILSCIR